MNRRELITQQLQDSIDEATARGLCDLYAVYNVREPLLAAIRAGEPSLLASEYARSFIAEILSRAKREDNARPRNLDIQARNFRLLAELHYLNGAGVPMYGTSKADKATACEQIAARYHLTEQTVRDLWKARKQEEHPLFSAARKAGKATKGV
ncbi:hypothetical protein [Marinobacter sp.]|uniref:hypothetical protein n=1 Tax=Marinobacter sp. TaxID=50741 RepID=UPI0019CBEC01|nr:hypothetical protein [Marinobacter sp.]MBD3655514.1 hypothetical protein [Marinobacter sp.]